MPSLRSPKPHVRIMLRAPGSPPLRPSLCGKQQPAGERMTARARVVRPFGSLGVVEASRPVKLLARLLRRPVPPRHEVHGRRAVGWSATRRGSILIPRVWLFVGFKATQTRHHGWTPMYGGPPPPPFQGKPRLSNEQRSPKS